MPEKDVVKKWTVFCPLVGELRDPAMRPRHWTQLMDLCGKQIQVTREQRKTHKHRLFQQHIRNKYIFFKKSAKNQFYPKQQKGHKQAQ